MTTPQTAPKSQLPVVQSASKIMEYTPFGGTDKVKLTVTIVQNLIAVKTKSGKTCSEQDALKFMAMCQARRLNPFEGDAFLIGYDNKDGFASFSLITAHQAFLKRAEVHPEYNGMKSGVIVQPGYTCSACSGERVITVRDELRSCPICRGTGLIDEVEGDVVPEEQKLLGGWAEVFFVKRTITCHKRVLLKRFQKPWGIWQEDPAGMICKVAEADALRSAFPTMLGGLYLREEVEFIDVKAETVAPSPTFLGPPQTSPAASEEAPGSEPAEKPVRGPKTPPKPSQTPNKATPEPEPEPEPVETVGAAENAQSDAPEEEGQDVSAMSWEDSLKFLLKIMEKANVSEDQLTVWLKEQKIAKPNQQIRDLSGTKIKDLIARWSEIEKDVAAIQI